MEKFSLPRRDSEDLSDLPQVPKYIHAKDGQVFHTEGRAWHLPSLMRNGGFVITWDQLEEQEKPPILSKRSRYLLKLYVADALRKKKPGTVLEHYRSFYLFGRWLSSQNISFLTSTKEESFNWTDLDERITRAFLSWRKTHTTSAMPDLCHLRSLYTWGVARQYPDFSRDMLRILKSIKIPGKISGQNVRFRHPVKGPLSPDEVLLLREAIKGERGMMQDRALVMLHLELGINPYATMQILNKDFKRYDGQSEVYYHVNVPRIKKRTVHRETKQRPISKELGRLLETLQQGGSEDFLFYWLPQGSADQAIIYAMRRFVEMTNLESSRTGTLLNLHPRRFRYTLATHMAEEGASKFHIAEVLDHSDLQNTHVYTQTVSSIAELVANATDPTLGPVVRRFLGKIVDSTKTQASEGSVNAAVPALIPHLSLPMLNTGGVGMCGRDVRKDGLCRLLPPLSCYRCSFFAALRTGPHKEMLESIEVFIQDIRESVDARILKQLDEVRIAIMEVVEVLEVKKIDDDKSTEKEK